MLEGLDRIDWSSLHHAYGSAALTNFGLCALELRHLGRRDMLRNATFSGFFAIDKNSTIGINP